jgi:ribosomal subunit interface protein
MHKRITFRNMDHVASIENYANNRLNKVEDFLESESSPVFIDLVLEPSKVHEHHRVELRVKSPSYDLISNYEGPEFYKVLDHVVDVMMGELTKEKRKEVDSRKHHIKTSKAFELKGKEMDEDDEDYDDEDYDDEDEDDEDYDDDDYDIEFDFDEDEED